MTPTHPAHRWDRARWLSSCSRLAPSAAHAADTGGRIDHVETDGDPISVLFSVPGLPRGRHP